VLALAEWSTPGPVGGAGCGRAVSRRQQVHARVLRATRAEHDATGRGRPDLAVAEPRDPAYRSRRNRLRPRRAGMAVAILPGAGRAPCVERLRWVWLRSE